eukprot:759076-Hanusia_phi.AAC.6
MDLSDLQDDVQILADITAGPALGQSYTEDQSNSRWTAPSTIEARMLGLTDISNERRRENSLIQTKNGVTSSKLPQEVIDVVIQLGRQGQAQAVAAKSLREMIHHKKLLYQIASEAWVFDVIANALVEGNNETRASCCACFRHLALEEEGCVRMIGSANVLSSLVVALQFGDDNARQKAAAAIGNLSWRTERNREVICSKEGIINGLLTLLRVGGIHCKESALAALSNLTLSKVCASAVVSSFEALNVLTEELTSGSMKGQLRAAGIVRNLAAHPENRASLLSFPGLLASLESLLVAKTNSEAVKRAEAAYRFLRGTGVGSIAGSGIHMTASGSKLAEKDKKMDLDKHSASRLKSNSLNVSEKDAEDLLHEWLSNNGWEDLPGRLLDIGKTDYSTFNKFEKDLLPLDLAAGKYLWQGRVVLLITQQNNLPQYLLDTETGDLLWSYVTCTEFFFPWARKNFVCKYEGRSTLILLRRSGRVVARKDREERQLPSLTGSNVLSVDDESQSIEIEDVSKVLAEPVIIHSPENSPRDPAQNEEASVQNASEGGSEEFDDSLVVLQEKRSPILNQLLEWGSLNGWKDVERSLFRAGRTDYSQYAVYEREMQEVPGKANIFTWRGKTLELIGENRRNPTRLIDVSTNQVVWDMEKCTKLRFPWARDNLEVKKENGCLIIVEKSSGEALLKIKNKSQQAAKHNIGSGLDIRMAIEKLKEWTEQNGWYDLHRRLINAGKTDYRRYGEIEPFMTAVPGHSDLFTWEGRTLKLIGHRKDPAELRDHKSGEVLWEFDSSTKFYFPWAREHFHVQVNSQRVQIISKISGQVIGNCSKKEAEIGDAMIMQSISKEMTPLVQVTARRHTVSERTVKVLRDFVEEQGTVDEATKSSQLRVSSGDIVVVLRLGLQGWNFGKLAMDSAGTRYFQKDINTGWGAEGWFPSSYAVSIHVGASARQHVGDALSAMAGGPAVAVEEHQDTARHARREDDRV